MVNSDELHQGSFSVRVDGGAVRGPSPEVLAQRFRLRGPDQTLRPLKVDHLLGEVRFTAVQPLTPGTYTLEHHANFDDEGRRMRFGSYGEVARSEWFPYERLEFTGRAPAAASKLRPPRHVRWARMHRVDITSAGPFRTLDVVGKAPPGTRIEAEVEGVGVVSRAVVGTKGKVAMRHATSLCTPYAVDVPLSGDLRVRLVAVGPDGSRAPASWTTLGSSAGRHFNGSLANRSRKSGVPAPLTAFRTWQAVDHTPPAGETKKAQTTCGRLVANGPPVAFELAPDAVVRADADQVFRRVGMTAGQLTLDGEQVDWVMPSREGTGVHLAGVGETLTLGIRDQKTQVLYLLRLRGTEVVAQAEVLGVNVVSAFDLDGSEVRVAWRENTGIRWVQRFKSDLSPVSPPVEVMDPLQIKSIRGGGWGIGVNGHSVATLDRHNLQREQTTDFEGRAYISANSENGGAVAVVEANGSTVWTLPFERDVGVRRMVVDEGGVHLDIEDYRTGEEIRTVRTFTHDGVEVLPTLPMPAEVRKPYRGRPTTTTRIHHLDRTLVVSQGRTRTLGVEENGVRSPETPIAFDAVVAVRPTGAALVWTTGRRSRTGLAERRTWSQSLECAGDAMGIPEVWKP